MCTKSYGEGKVTKSLRAGDAGQRAGLGVRQVQPPPQHGRLLGPWMNPHLSGLPLMSPAVKWVNHTYQIGLCHDTGKPQAGLEVTGAISLERRTWDFLSFYW